MTESNISSPYPALLLFTDIVDSSVHSSFLGINVYASRVVRFQKLFKSLSAIYFPEIQHSDHVTQWADAKAQGDEGLVFVLDPERNGKELLLRAIKFAYELKMRWFLANKEFATASEDPAPRGMDIAIGMHYGEVVPVTSLGTGEEPRNEITGIIGYAINYAKRVESSSRIGKYSRVFLSRDASLILKHTDVLFQEHKVSLKGLGDTEFVYEVKAVLLDEIPVLGGDSGVEQIKVTKLIAGEINERDLLTEGWMRSYIMAASSCLKDTKMPSFVWAGKEQSDIACLIGCATECINSGKPTRAIAYLKDALRDNPDFKRARLMLIDSCWKVLLAKESLSSDRVFVRDSADELLNHYADILSQPEKESLHKIIEAIANEPAQPEAKTN